MTGCVGHARVRAFVLVDEIRPVIGQLNIVVHDMAAAVNFWRLLGVEVSDTVTEWMAHHRAIASTAEGLDADLDSSAYAGRWSRGIAEGWTGVVIGLRVNSRDGVDALYEKITSAGYIGQQPPYDAFWGARYAAIEGPDGIVVGVMSPVSDAVRTPPPSPPAG